MPQAIAKPARSLLAPATANSLVQYSSEPTILRKYRCLVTPGSRFIPAFAFGERRSIGHTNPPPIPD
jgi:hypothetical protein